MSKHFAHINRLQKHAVTQVLLYHSTFTQVPTDLQIGLHNVTPDALHEQVSWLKKYFDCVSVDELFQNPASGKVAITFDDGYTSVFQEALPVLDALQVPCTIFLNGCSLQGKVFWRDKVRYLLNEDLVGPFLESYKKLHGTTDGMAVDTFYRTSKLAAVSSRKVDAAIDEFLRKHSVDLSQQIHCVRDPSLLIRSPLVTYGNHTMNHYVLSSLSKEEQRAEILDNHALLASLNLPLSRLFSIPFGDTTDFNDDTLAIAREAGYDGFLYSRNRLNILRHKQLPTTGGFPFAERYMVPPRFADFQKQLLGMWIRETFRQ